jgi:hypothetical protein
MERAIPTFRVFQFYELCALLVEASARQLVERSPAQPLRLRLKIQIKLTASGKDSH